MTKKWCIKWRQGYQSGFIAVLNNMQEKETITSLVNRYFYQLYRYLKGNAKNKTHFGEFL